MACAARREAVFGVLVRVMRPCSLLVLACAGPRCAACAGPRDCAGVPLDVEAGWDCGAIGAMLGKAGLVWLLCCHLCVCGG